MRMKRFKDGVMKDKIELFGAGKKRNVHNHID